MNTHLIKPILAITWLLLATSSLQAWQGGRTAGGNTAKDTAAAPLDSAPPFSPDEPGALKNQIHTDRVATMRQELQQLELAVQAGSEIEESLGVDKDNQQRELRKHVEQAFDLRQQLQRLEAQRMQLKLQLIEANLDARDKNREDIIQHRVNELLDSNGKLTRRGAGNKPTPTTNPEMPVTGTPIGLPGTPHLPYGDPAGLASHQVRNSDARIQWPQPVEIGKDLQKRRNKVEFCLFNLEQRQQKVELWLKPLEELKAAGIADPKMSETLRSAEIASAKRAVEDNRETFDRALREWNQAWAYYHTQLRLLQLDVEEAKLAVEPLQQNHDRLKRMADGFASVSEVTQAASDLAIARIKVQRAEELLKLYADIETQEPELNPASLKAVDPAKPDSSPKPVPDLKSPRLQDSSDPPLAPPVKAVKP